MPNLASPDAEARNPAINRWARKGLSSTHVQARSIPLREEGNIPQAVAKRAAEAPTRLAVAQGAEALTYQALLARSNRLARHLQSLGAKPETLVGICLERSLDYVASALGILMAGAAYLPLDPSYPPDRIANVLSDARVGIVVTRPEFAAQLPPGQWELVKLDRKKNELAGYSSDPMVSPSQPENLAYVIYTSGSTGRPKGVQVTHANLLNLVRWHQGEFGITPADRATQLASPAFDAAVWELWPYLCAGASVHIPDDETRAAPEALRDWLTAERITITFAPTALAEHLIALRWPSNTTLRILLTGAEALQHYPPDGLPFALVNNYGPTECTVVATSAVIAPENHPACRPPIGLPIANTFAYILDDELCPVAAGQSGELYIGGAGVARGYLNRPEWTAVSFLPDPFRTEPRARMYRTGDRARVLPDGQIEFLGRVDEQLKIRGYRVEPAEISAALNQDPAVQSGVVIAREDVPGVKRLVAYVLPKSGCEIDENALRRRLQAQLPDYMVPSAFVRLENLPLTPNGKLDRSALPAPDKVQTQPAVIPAPECADVQGRLAAILAELLGLREVGTTDNFFLLGGHSLLGTQLIARIRDAFGVELSLRSLFDQPTVAEIAAEIERLQREGEHLFEDLLRAAAQESEGQLP